MVITPLIPRQPVPELEVATVGGDTWKLSEQTPENFSLVVFYRGFHCPVCRSYLRDLQEHLEKLSDLGVTTVAVSSDTQERAEKTKEEWKLGQVTLGYGLELDKAQRVGALHLEQPRQNFHGCCRARPVQRARPLPGAPRRHAVLWRSANHALRPPAL